MWMKIQNSWILRIAVYSVLLVMSAFKPIHMWASDFNRPILTLITFDLDHIRTHGETDGGTHSELASLDPEHSGTVAFSGSTGVRQGVGKKPKLQYTLDPERFAEYRICAEDGIQCVHPAERLSKESLPRRFVDYLMPRNGMGWECLGEVRYKTPLEPIRQWIYPVYVGGFFNTETYNHGLGLGHSFLGTRQDMLGYSWEVTRGGYNVPFRAVFPCMIWQSPTTPCSRIPFEAIVGLAFTKEF